MTGDLINGSFEAIGAISAWMNYFRLKRDREVKGIVWQFTIFWFAWGLWNLYYYPSLDQYISFFSGIALCAGNVAWLGLLGYIAITNAKLQRILQRE